MSEMIHISQNVRQAAPGGLDGQSRRWPENDGYIVERAVIMDIRIGRTQKMLLDAFEKLAEEKNIEDISVSELCERSTIRRSTFYRHFCDKYAFIEFYMQTLAEMFMQEAESGCDLDEIYAYAQHMHMALVRFLRTHPKVKKKVFDSTASVGIIDMIIRQIAEGITIRLARKLESEEHGEDVPVDLLGIFYSAGMVHTLRWWFLEGKPFSAETIEQYCTAFLVHCYTDIKKSS